MAGLILKQRLGPDPIDSSPARTAAVGLANHKQFADKRWANLTRSRRLAIFFGRFSLTTDGRLVENRVHELAKLTSALILCSNFRVPTC
jgi:hypothetical protein